mmetsp:Transcript_18731/g.51449  ORF Transcript_18731/g.51449 Transcript_18731/m.51449 type:complete len:313 (-) Transcript_18731:25-963(-)
MSRRWGSCLESRRLRGSWRERYRRSACAACAAAVCLAAFARLQVPPATFACGGGARDGGTAGRHRLPRLADAEQARVGDRHGLERRQLGSALLVSLMGAGGASDGVAVTSEAGEDAASKRVNDFLRAVPVWVVTNKDGQPALEGDEGKERVARFYFEEAPATEALRRFGGEAGGEPLEVRLLPLSEVYLPFIANGDEAQLGGRLVLEPLPEEVRHARQIVQRPDLGPAGTVPLFMYPGLELDVGAKGSQGFIPAFVREKDLRTVVKNTGAMVDGSKVQVALLQDVAAQLLKPESQEGVFPRLRAVARVPGKL